MFQGIKRAAKVAAWIIIFLCGLGYRFLDVMGHGEQLVNLPGYAAHLQTFALAHQELGYRVLPWVLMAASLGGLVLMQWPHALTFWKARPPVLASKSGGLAWAIAPAGSRPITIPLPEDGAPTYMEGYEATDYIASESDWGKKIAKEMASQGGDNYQLLRTLTEFRDRAQEGKVRVLGRLGGDGQHQEISATYWLSGGLDVNTTARKQSSDTSPWIPQGAGVPVYRNVLINRSDVYQTWPHSLPDRVPIQDAAIWAFDTARETKSWIALAAEKLGNLHSTRPSSQQEILQWMITFVAGRLRVYGSRLPNGKITELDKKDRKNRLDRFSSLQVDRSELNELIVKIRTGLREDTPI